MPGRPAFPLLLWKQPPALSPTSSFHPPPACDFLFIFGSVLRKCLGGGSVFAL